MLKVILETCLLEDAQKARACRLAREAGLDFVKTSTGFSAGGATRPTWPSCGPRRAPAMGVKASGGIRDYAAALAMVKAGATAPGRLRVPGHRGRGARGRLRLLKALSG